MSAKLAAQRSPRQGPCRAPDRPCRARRAVPPVPVRRRRHPVARPAGERATDRRVQPVPPAARGVPAERPDVRLRGRGPDRGAPARRARVDPRRVDDRGARRRRDGQRRRHPLSARAAAAARGRQASRRALPRRLRRRGRQRRAADAGRLHAATARSGSCCAAGDGSPAEAVDGRASRRLRDPAGHPARRAARCRGCIRAVTPGAGRPPRGLAPGRLGAPGRPTRACRAPASRRSCASRTSRGSCRLRRTAARTARRSTAFLQVGVAKEDQPHYLKIMARPGAGHRRSSSTSAWASSRPGPARRDHRHDHGVFAPVRTYESPIDRRLEEAGFESIASVTLLMKETLVRVAEPALVPAGVR